LWGSVYQADSENGSKKQNEGLAATLHFVMTVEGWEKVVVAK